MEGLNKQADALTGSVYTLATIERNSRTMLCFPGVNCTERSWQMRQSWMDVSLLRWAVWGRWCRQESQLSVSAAS